MVAAYGGTSLTLYSLSSAHVNDHVPADEKLGASSTLILVNGAGAFIAPIVVAAVMGVVGNDTFLPLLAVMHLLLAAYAIFRMVRRAAVPASRSRLRRHAAGHEFQRRIAGSRVGSGRASFWRRRSFANAWMTVFQVAHAVRAAK